MTILRAGLVVLLLGGLAPAALFTLAHPAQAEDGGGDADAGGPDAMDYSEDNDVHETTEEEEVRARQAAPARGPDFSTLTTGHIPNQTVTVTTGASRFP